MPDALSAYVLTLDEATARLGDIETVAAGGSEVRVALPASFGSEERSNRFNQIAGIPETESYAERLRARGDVRVRSMVLDGETHSSVFPRAVARALTEVYGADASR